jgi:DNA-directed RNA polymerase subunit beta'
LRGLKENVIVGRLIPAGTGLAFHKARKAREENDAQEQAALAAAEAEALFTKPEETVEETASEAGDVSAE